MSGATRASQIRNAVIKESSGVRAEPCVALFPRVPHAESETERRNRIAAVVKVKVVLRNKHYSESRWDAIRDIFKGKREKVSHFNISEFYIESES